VQAHLVAVTTPISLLLATSAQYGHTTAPRPRLNPKKKKMIEIKQSTKISRCKNSVIDANPICVMIELAKINFFLPNFSIKNVDINENKNADAPYTYKYVYTAS
jgi:hypothetical protein